MRKAKRFCCSLFFSFCVIVIIGICGYVDSTYTRKGYVTSVDGSMVTIVDRSNHEWLFEGEGFHVGENVRMKMFNNGTDNIIIDDEIKSIKVIK